MTLTIKEISEASSTKTELTTKQIAQLAKEYRKIAGTIRDYRSVNWDNLNSSERRQLTRLADKCMDYSDDYIYLGVRLAIGSKEVKQAVGEIATATKEMKKAIKKLTNIKKVILIATASVTLAGAIVSGNIEAVGGAIADVYVAIKHEEDNDSDS